MGRSLSRSECKHTSKFIFIRRSCAVLLIASLMSTAALAADSSNSSNLGGAPISRHSSDNDTRALSNTSRVNTLPSSCWGWSPSCLASSNNDPTFVLIGDSITAFGFNDGGWVTRLSLSYHGAVNMINYGVEGATTRRVDEIADKLLQQLGPHIQQVQLATICFGANDAVTPRSPRWHLPLPQYKNNLMRLVARLRENGISRVILMTPPPVGRRGDRSNAATKAYADEVKQLAQELQLESVDIYSSIMAVDSWQDTALDKDQLHLSAIGQEVVYNSIMQLLANSSDISPARLAGALQQQRQQHHHHQQQQQHVTAGGQGASDGSQALKVVLCGLMLVLFAAVITESKRQPAAVKKEAV